MAQLNPFQISLSKLLIATAIFGSLLGLAIELPFIYRSFLFAFFIANFLVLVVEPWLPMLDVLVARGEPETVEQIRDSKKGPITLFFRQWQLKSWSVFFIAVAIFGIGNLGLELLFESVWQFVLVGWGFISLLIILLLTTLFYPLIGIYYGLADRPFRYDKSLTLSCLSRFQMQGWSFILLVVAIIMTLAAFGVY